MKVAIIGAGNAGQALGLRFSEVGHAVTYGVRDPSDPKHAAMLDAQPGVSLAVPADAARGAEVVVLAVPGQAAADAVWSLGDLGGAVLVDATNMFGPGLAGLDPDAIPSGGEVVAAHAVNARVVKAFNTTGSANMRDPSYPQASPVMLVAGDDADAKHVVAGLAAALGFDPVDAGPLSAARGLEELALLWVRLAYQLDNGPDIAFALLRRNQ